MYDDDRWHLSGSPVIPPLECTGPVIPPLTGTGTNRLPSEKEPAAKVGRCHLEDEQAKKLDLVCQLLGYRATWARY